MKFSNEKNYFKDINKQQIQFFGLNFYYYEEILFTRAFTQKKK